MTRFILIRHGESEANRNNVFAGHIDPNLLEKGVLQAQKTAEFIAANYQVDAIYSSDLTRAYRTAKALGDLLGLTVTKDPTFREVDAGEWENVKYIDLVERFPEDFGNWMSCIGHAVCTGGESVKELGERVMAGLERLAGENEGKTIVVATHATPVRVAHSLVTTGGLDEMQNIPWASNASATVFEYQEGKWSLVAASLDEHLGELKTTLPKSV